MQGRWSLWSTEKLRRIPWKVRFETLQTIVTISFLALEKSDIVDTNGAGDAFVGGFLAQWVLGNVSGDSSPLLSSLLLIVILASLEAETMFFNLSTSSLNEVSSIFIR